MFLPVIISYIIVRKKDMSYSLPLLFDLSVEIHLILKDLISAFVY